MSQFFQYIAELFKQFSPPVQVLLVLLIGGLMFFGYNFVLNESFRRSLITLTMKLGRSMVGNVQLLNHDLFFKQKYLISFARHVRFVSPHKTKLFHVLLEEKIKAGISVTRDFIKKVEYNKCNNELFDVLLNNMLTIIETYEKSIKESFIFSYGTERGSKLYELVYNSKGIGFKDVHDEHVAFIRKNIEKISHSKAFSIKQKIYHYLTQIEIALELAVTDCETTFGALNGDIDKIVNS